MKSRSKETHSPANQGLGIFPGPVVYGQHLSQIFQGRGSMLGHGFFHHPGYAGERQASGQERGHGHFVGRVEHRGMVPPVSAAS